MQVETDTTTEWADQLLTNGAPGWPLALRDRLASDVAAVRPDDLAALAEHRRQDAVFGLLGDEPRLRRSWNEAAR